MCGHWFLLVNRSMDGGNAMKTHDDDKQWGKSLPPTFTFMVYYI